MIGNPKQGKKKKKPNSIPKKIVREVFARDENICQRCGILTAGLEEDSLLLSAHCHHRIHRSQGGKNTVGNLQTECFNCHYLEHN